MNLRISFLAALLFVCSCLLLAGDQAKTMLKIVVKSETGKPVENAEVMLDFLGGRQVTKAGLKKKIHWEVHTNQEGLAHFPPVPEGAIQLQVNKKNFQTFGERVDLAGEEQTVSITLARPQSQYSVHAPLKPAEPPKK